MKTENELYMRNKLCGGRRAEKMPPVEMKDTPDNGACHVAYPQRGASVALSGRSHYWSEPVFHGKRLSRGAKKMGRYLNALHDRNRPLAVAVTHDINVAAFFAARGVVESFTEET